MPEAITNNTPPSIGTCPLPTAPKSTVGDTPEAVIQEVGNGGSSTTNGGTRARPASDTTTIGGDSRQSTFTL